MLKLMSPHPEMHGALLHICRDRMQAIVMDFSFMTVGFEHLVKVVLLATLETVLMEDL